MLSIGAFVVAIAMVQAGDANSPRAHAESQEIEIPRSAGFITSGGAIAVVGYKEFGKAFAGFPQSADVVEKVSDDRSGIGFAAANRGSPSVRALALVSSAHDEPVPPTATNIMDGRYPLDRFLLIYARRPPLPLVREFLRLVLSREGQEVVATSPQGYLPLSAAEAAAERAKLE